VEPRAQVGIENDLGGACDDCAGDWAIEMGVAPHTVARRDERRCIWEALAQKVRQCGVRETVWDAVTPSQSGYTLFGRLHIGNERHALHHGRPKPSSVDNVQGGRRDWKEI
jgi:hypothetical protein